MLTIKHPAPPPRRFEPDDNKEVGDGSDCEEFIALIVGSPEAREPMLVEERDSADWPQWALDHEALLVYPDAR